MLFRLIPFARLISAVVLPSSLLLAQPPLSQQPTPSTLTTSQLITRLTAAISNLKTLRAVVDARERIGNKYIPAVSTIKVITKPLQIYLKNQKGVEVLYVTGQNNGDAWVYPAAFPYITLSLDPKGALMRRDQHHTALQIGFGTISDLLEGSDKLLDKSFNRSFRYVGDSTTQRRACYVLRSDYPQFRYISYKAGKNETPATVAARYGCGEYRILERNNLSPSSQLSEGQVIQVPNAYARRTIVLVDPKSFLPISVTVYDDRGLYERFEFSNVITNQPIPAEEFQKGYKGYKL
ncbi:DUF1571 domain-containing protein [Hymenobacter sp. HMF4947]|uniref:DUF1571 domain-containing protein n=1 Tax=Hymenobacter ginkgonis TaxID=2682976 RepID=A0A7K1TAM9_9BACT|nr:DUF1571 domain-containing protein [Hymenobacter ginkgonis]MVN75454.1 DUF1571 domain-containing protein [Hymenobacter ginkgonis]